VLAALSASKFHLPVAPPVELSHGGRAPVVLDNTGQRLAQVGLRVARNLAETPAAQARFDLARARVLREVKSLARQRPRAAEVLVEGREGLHVLASRAQPFAHQPVLIDARRVPDDLSHSAQGAQVPGQLRLLRAPLGGAPLADALEHGLALIRRQGLIEDEDGLDSARHRPAMLNALAIRVSGGSARTRAPLAALPTRAGP
jgi:hypothetical protein